MSDKKEKKAHKEVAPAVGVEEGAALTGKKRPRTAVQGPLSPIAQPMAGKKLRKHVYKLVEKAAAGKVLKRGVKEVVKAVRKGEKGVCILAGDIAPLDVISHIPVLCEDATIPYVYVTSKAELGAAASTKRPTSVVLVAPGKKDFDGKDKMVEVVAEIKDLVDGEGAAGGAGDE